MACDRLTAKQILKPQFFPAYERDMDMFFGQLVRLNDTVYMVEQIVQCPFPTVTESRFFQLVVDNFVQAAVLIISRIWSDKGKKCRTLPRFVEELRQSIPSEEHRSCLDACLHEAGFEQGGEGLFDRIVDPRISRLFEQIKKNLRHKRVVHIQKDREPFPDDVAWFDVTPLNEVGQTLSRYYRALLLNKDALLLSDQYLPQRSLQGSDIGRLLCILADRSDLLRAPDHQPEYWHALRSQWSDDRIRDFNRYREEFKLQPA